MNQVDGEKMLDFMTGFNVTARILWRIAGGVSAVILFAAAVLLILFVTGLVFDRLTNALARKWEQTGHAPRNKLERIILENHKRLGR